MSRRRRREQRFSRPVYEGLPWLYLICGVLGLAMSYVQRASGFSVVIGLFGLTCLIGGLVVLLRRRDFRELRSNYENPEE